MKVRLDSALVERGLVSTRSQAESYIKLGRVTVDGRVVTKAGFMVGLSNGVELSAGEQYVSRAGLKLASVAEVFQLEFRNKTVLDVGSSTGGFSDYALQHGAKKIFAIDIGTNQLHPDLRVNPKIELHEQTDIRGYVHASKISIDIVLIDVSFISLTQILPAVANLVGPECQIISMVKPQFEAAAQNLKHKGVIKNETLRRNILRDFESWAKRYFKIINKADSQVSGEKGNKERFYLLRKLV